MKKVNKNIVIKPRSLESGRVHFDNAINNLGIQKCWPVNYSNIYKSNSVKENLEIIYKGKCAFCNQIPKGSPLQVEHFRPKNGIRNETHTGYYWLGYEWTNLLFACGNCNTTKNNYFPLLPNVIRVPSPSWITPNNFDLNDCLANSSILKDEKYFLINPEIDKPDKHLFYEADGKISYFDTRGELSIKRYSLNRDELYLDGRKKLLDEVLKKIGNRFLKYTNKEIDIKNLYSQIVDIIKEEIIDPIHLNESFDHFRYTIFKNYNMYIIPRFGISEHQYLLKLIFSNLNQGLTVKLN